VSTHRFTFSSAAAIAVAALAPASESEAQSSVAVSPFVSYVPSAATNPLAGMSLTFGGTTGLALRTSADVSLSTPRVADSAAANGSTGGARPWAADADVMLLLSSLFGGGGPTAFNHTFSPYLFSGIGMVGGDSAGRNVVHNGWSYGAGALVPLGQDADIFGEARWRMSQYVLPTSNGAPDSKSEMRFGVAFHVGGGDSPAPRRRYADNYDDEVVTAPVVVPQQQPVIVQQAPPPTVIVQQPDVIEQPAREVIVRERPQRVNEININLGHRRVVHRTVVRRVYRRGPRQTTTVVTKVITPEMRRRRR
jgi:hypothetical protein